MKRILLLLTLITFLAFFIYSQNIQVLAGDCDCYCIRHEGVVGCDTSDGPEGSIKCLTPNFCTGGGGGGGGGDGGSGDDHNPPQPTSTPVLTPTPTPTPTPVVIPVMGIKFGSLANGANLDSMVLTSQDLTPLEIKSKALISEINFMRILFTDNHSSLGTSSLSRVEPSSQRGLIQSIISSLLSLFNPF